MQLEIIIAVVLLTRKDCLHAWLFRYQNDGFPMGCSQGNLNTILIKVRCFIAGYMAVTSEN